MLYALVSVPCEPRYFLCQETSLDFFSLESYFQGDWSISLSLLLSATASVRQTSPSVVTEFLQGMAHEGSSCLPRGPALSVIWLVFGRIPCRNRPWDNRVDHSCHPGALQANGKGHNIEQIMPAIRSHGLCQLLQERV